MSETEETKEIVKTNAVTDTYLKHLIPVIRDQKIHKYFDWDDAIEYLIERLEGMKETTSHEDNGFIPFKNGVDHRFVDKEAITQREKHFQDHHDLAGDCRKDGLNCKYDVSNICREHEEPLPCKYCKTLEHFDNCPVYKKYNQCACLLPE